MAELHIRDAAAEERDKYAEICAMPEYNEVHPGLESADWFLEVVKPKRFDSIIDIGCGAGGAGLKFEAHGMQVNYLDLVDVRLDPKIDRRKFIEATLWDYRWPLHRRQGWDYGFCCDVLEHMPKEFSMLVVDRILHCCRTAWLQVALVPETHGQLINKPLHLTVGNFEWWRDRLAALGNLIDARDIFPRALFIVKR